MLTLNRHVGEAIMIGEDIRLVVIEVRRDGKVRLGIEAPREVPVHRLEIFRDRQARAARGEGGAP